MTRETITYRGHTYQRYPDSARLSDRKYFRDHGRLLHAEVYRHEVGPIPPGHQIHHRDNDPGNNNAANLEALSKADHDKLHPRRKGPLSPAALTAAAAWHASPEGIAWHQVNAQSLWATQLPKDYICERCGKQFSSLKRGIVRTCSNACKSALRRREGHDNITVTCEECSTPFKSNKYDKPRFCTQQCSNTWTARNRKPMSSRQEHD